MPRKSGPPSAASRRSLATFVLADDPEHVDEDDSLGRQGMKPPFAHIVPAPAPASAHTLTPTPQPKPKSKSKPAPVFAPAAPAAAPIPMASSIAPEEMDTDRPSESAPPSDKKGERTADLNLPKSIITRLAKGVLPPNTQIQANAILAMTKSATVFINHLASAANERTLASGKKTILPDDVFEALDEIEYSQFRDRLQAEFKKFNETRTTKRNTYRRRVAAAKKGLPLPADPNASMVSNATSEGATEVGDISTASAAGTAAGEVGSSEQQPRSKKAKTGGAPGEDSTMDMDEEAGGHTEPEDEVDEEEEEEDDDDDDEANQDDDEGDEDDEEDMQDAMEERENAGEEDEALDNGDDSDA
ncbi:uncharacterized protein PG998_001473 [Apiospora kogelbergensis]|uniref:uncharacterized protein n=1 Tax=Apiospora kogelbergensis TaxID=1337665 RepID=UPI00312F70D5